MSFHKYPKVRRPAHPETDGLFAHPDHELVVLEKLDGNNYRITYDQEIHAFRHGSRNVDLGRDVDEIGGMFEDVSRYLEETIELSDLAVLCGEVQGQVVLYGENAVVHTIKDYQYEEMPQFSLFDIYVDRSDNEGDSEWLDWDTIEEIGERFGLETVPVVDRMPVGELDPETFEIPTSEYRPNDAVAEGVVFRNTTNQIKAKQISEEFAEKHESAKSKNYDKRSDDVGRFLTAHATERRIEKNVYDVLGNPEHDYDGLQMEMMEVLVTEVWEDLWEEDLHEIIYEDYELDIAETRSATSSKTARVLRELIRAESRDVPTVNPGTGEIRGLSSDDEADDE